MMVAALLHGSLAMQQAAPVGELWEESASAQQIRGYHPMIRFSSWTITRFNRSSTYMFLSPDMVQQGQFEVTGNRYFFRAVMANELENADKSKLMADMDPGAARSFDEAYARSMSNFEGRYDPGKKALYITYLVKGIPKTYELHSSTEGNEQRKVSISDFERGLAGVWYTPEPFPNKLDARTRNKVQEQGLQLFVGEAAASEGAIFSQLDLRVDRSFRIHETIGTWSRNGSILTLSANGKTKQYEISRDGMKLTMGGKAAYVRQ